MALYISAGRRRRTAIVAAVVALIVGMGAGFVVGRSSATTVEDRIAEGRAAGQRFASSLRVLPLEYEQAVTDAGESGGAAAIVDRSLDGADAAFDAAPWLGDGQIAAVRERLDVVRRAPTSGLSPEEFTAAVDEAAAAVEVAFGVAGTESPG